MSVTMSVTAWLEEQLLQRERNMGGGILCVNDFLNHRVNPERMAELGEMLAKAFRHLNPTLVLTAEISGIAPAAFTAQILGIPFVFARKHQPITMEDPIYRTVAPSHTKGNLIDLMVSGKVMGPKDRVLIIDDFLASGSTLLALCRLVEQAGATLVGIGTAIEKKFEGGSDALAHLGVPIVAGVTIAAMEDKVGGKITLEK